MSSIANQKLSSMANQKRCVFVGNIPYRASEEKMVEICEEIGPVVSFRLVVDKETGKLKGYGFCEYKDEETALSALRNLKGYMIHGRELHIDFAENGKIAERNKDQIQMASSHHHPSHLAQTGNPNLVTPQQPVPPQQVPITTSVGPSIFQPLQTHPNIASSGAWVPQLQSTVLQQNLRLSFGVANLTQQPASSVPSISMPKKKLARLASQVVPSTGQQLLTRAEMLQSEVNPWSELNRASKRRRCAFTDITNDWSAMNTPSFQEASQMSTATAMQSEMLQQKLSPEEQSFLELSPEEQSFLLQQVLRLTPDQLTSLSMEEQQQVFQLQKVLSSASW